MSTGRPPPGTIPTLTEVVAWPEPRAPEVEVAAAPASAPEPARAAAPIAPPIPVAVAAPVPVVSAPAVAAAVVAAPVVPAPAVPAPAPAPVAAPVASSKPATAGSAPADVQLTQRVLADLQKQVELMLEVRLREALAPILARASDALVRDARKELTAAMRDIVSRSIARELGRREDR